MRPAAPGVGPTLTSFTITEVLSGKTFFLTMMTISVSADDGHFQKEFASTTLPPCSLFLQFERQGKIYDKLLQVTTILIDLL